MVIVNTDEAFPVSLQLGEIENRGSIVLDEYVAFSIALRLVAHIARCVQRNDKRTIVPERRD